MRSPSTFAFLLLLAGLPALAVDAPTAPSGATPAPKPAAATPAPGPKPTMANVPYGKHPKQVLDFYKAESDKPTPLVLFIHGGGWMGGAKDRVGVAGYLRAGISVVSVEYRFIDRNRPEIQSGFLQRFGSLERWLDDTQTLDALNDGRVRFHDNRPSMPTTIDDFIRASFKPHYSKETTQRAPGPEQFFEWIARDDPGAI